MSTDHQLKAVAYSGSTGRCHAPPPLGVTRNFLRLYCLNNAIFIQLIIGNIVKIVTTICQISDRDWTKFDFGPIPRWGSLQLYRAPNRTPVECTI